MQRVNVKYTDEYLDFPDDMDDEQMAAAIRAEIARPRTAQQAASDAIPKQQEMSARPRDESLAEKIRRGIGDALINTGVISNEAAAYDIGGNIGLGAEMLPVVGESVDVDDYIRASQSGDTVGMIASGAGLVPVVGGGLKKAINAVGDKVEQVRRSSFDGLQDQAIIDLDYLEGKSIVPQPADLTQAGGNYTGIDSSEVTPIELQGGPAFPWLDDFIEDGVVWAANDPAKLKTLQKGDIVAVTAMRPDAHESNSTVKQAFFSTLNKYVDDGRMSKTDRNNFYRLVKNHTYTDKKVKKTPFKDMPPPAAGEQAINEYLSNLTFEQRKQIAAIAKGKKAKALNVPNFQKILDTTIEDDFAGQNLGDAVILVEIQDGADALVKLGKDTKATHRSYREGLKGKPLGVLPASVGYKTLWRDFVAQKKAEEPDILDKDLYRAFTLAQPAQKIDKQMIEEMKRLQTQTIKTPRQAQLLNDFMQDNWKTSDDLVDNGGISTAEFIKGRERNTSSASLTPTSEKDLNRGIRKGDVKLYQLGDDGQVFFGIERNKDYNYEYGVDLAAAGLTDNEVALTNVISNEIGAKGIAGPSVMLKAIKEGATVLDAFAVKSPKFPNGFLPELYGEFGFGEVARVPFNEKYFVDEGITSKMSAAEKRNIRKKNRIRLEDLKANWRSEGWVEEDGYPDITVMKWKGNDNERQEFTEKWLNAIKSGDESGIIGRGSEEAISSADELISQSLGLGNRQVRQPNNARDNTGAVRDSGRPPITSKFGGLASELESLTPEQRVNLGLNND